MLRAIIFFFLVKFNKKLIAISIIKIYKSGIPKKLKSFINMIPLSAIKGKIDL